MTRYCSVHSTVSSIEREDQQGGLQRVIRTWQRAPGSSPGRGLQVGPGRAIEPQMDSSKAFQDSSLNPNAGPDLACLSC